MKNKKNTIIAATLSLATLLAPIEAFADTNASQAPVKTVSVSSEALHDLQIVSPNVTVESVVVTVLTPEESLALQSKLTGKSVKQLKEEQTKNNNTLATASSTYDANFSVIFDLGGGVKVQAGILAQVEQISFGGSIGRQFVKVYDTTGFLSPYSGGSFTVEKNYVQGTLQDSHHLQLSFSGYAQTAVTNSETSGVNMGVSELVNLGWSYSGTTSGTQYYRKQFNGSTTFVQN
jgi:hypothetical protein